jgi:hypothetical protein
MTLMSSAWVLILPMLISGLAMPTTWPEAGAGDGGAGERVTGLGAAVQRLWPFCAWIALSSLMSV